MSLRAREPRAAARSAAVILLVCAIAVAGLTIAQRSQVSALVNAISWVVVSFVAVGALAC
jgi:hypothetical protein